MRCKYRIETEEPNRKRNIVEIFSDYDLIAKEKAKTLAKLSGFKLISIIKEVEIPID